MFERYTEKARRIIFFARYEASNYGSPVIDTEHLLLGILRETTHVTKMLPPGAAQAIRAQLETRTPVRQKVPTSVDLPLSDASKRILKFGWEEAERMQHRHIGSEHLFLGLLREKGCLAAELLEPFGVELEQFRTKMEVTNAYDTAEGVLAPRYRVATAPTSTITIHGLVYGVEEVSGAVKRCRLHNWHWRKTFWKPRDYVTERQSGKVSLDMSLAEESPIFEVVKDGWKKDYCAICRWELFESDDKTHGLGLHQRARLGMHGVLREVLGSPRFHLGLVLGDHVAE
jgi:hypothetical protein